MTDGTRPYIQTSFNESLSTPPSRKQSIYSNAKSTVTVLEERPVFFEFCEESETYLKERTKERTLKEAEKKRPKEAKLVDGELKYGDDDEDGEEEVVEAFNSSLVEGANLPETFGTVPARLYGKPIEEIDHLIDDETFIVISKRMGKQQIFRYSASKALFVLHGYSWLRKMALYITTNQYFDYLVICTILANCVYLAIVDPGTEIPEYIFLFIYSFEMIVRILARGFILHKHSYLRDTWNWLDFFVVGSSYLTLLLELLQIKGMTNIVGLRTFRVFRALKTISIIPGLRIIVSALLQSLRLLAEVIILMLFCMSIFSLFGLQVYMGVLRQKCILQAPFVADNSTQNVTEYCDWWDLVSGDKQYWLEEEPEVYMICGNSSGSQNCPDGYQCMGEVGGNPNWGYTSFDNLGWALLTSFQLVTLDFWEDTYNKIIDATGPWNIVFFMIVIFFGSFYLINLMLAVVARSYQDADAARAEEELKTSEMRFDPSHLRMIKVQRRHSALSQGRKIVITKQGTISASRTSLRSTTNKILVSPGQTPREEHKLPNERNIMRTGIVVPDAAEKRKMFADGKIESNDTGIVSDVGTHQKEHSDETFATVEGRNHQRHTADFEVDGLIDRNCESCSVRCCRICGDYRCWLAFQNNLHYLVTDPFLEIFITFCILLNTVAMAMEYHGMSEDLRFALEIANYVFTSIFLLEALLKIIAMSRQYFQNAWNIFDLVIVIASVLDVVVTFLFKNAQFGVSVMRTFRLLRVFKLAQSWKTMRFLLKIIFSTVGALGNLTVVLAIIIYIFAVLGMQLFHNSYTAEAFGGEMPRWNFIDFFHSFIMIFRVLCSEWVEPLWDCMRVEGNTCFVVFIPALVLGNFMVLNLFLALLLNAFAVDSSTKEANTTAASSAPPEEIEDDRMKRRLEKLKRFFGCFRRKRKAVSPTEPSKNLELATTKTNAVEIKPSLENGDMTRSKTVIEDGMIQTETEEINQDLSRWQSFRSTTLMIVEHKIFETIILLLIAASSLSLCFEDVYLPERPWLREILQVANYVFATLFLIEMLLKWVAMGLKAYFTSFWTLLDFAIVAVSILTIVADILGLGGLGAFRSLRTLRALRPLRAISRWQGMKIVVNALMHAIPDIFNVLLVCLVFWLIFSIMGVEFFGGKFYKCLDDDGNKVDVMIVHNKSECLALNMTWENSNINYDHVLNGYLALFQVATFEGWMEIMEDATDAPDRVDEQPSYENGIGYYIYFLIFIIVGSFFTLNLFIGVIIDNFNRLKAKYEGNYLDIFLTDQQRDYYETMRKLGSRKPRKTIRRPNGAVQAIFYDIAVSSKFDIAITVLIFANMVSMAVEHYQQSAQISEILRYLNIVFTTTFTLEAVVKISGLRLHYFRKSWNVFDFVIVLLSLFGAIVEDFLSDAIISPSLLRVVRVFRIGRVLRLIRSAKGIRKLLFALIISLPALFNIAALLFLIMFIYAILGVSRFGHVKHTQALTDTVNFETFGNSIVLLFRLATSAGWNDVLEPLFIQPPNCNDTHVMLRNGTFVESDNGDCGDVLFATAYFVSYIFISFLIIINMYIAIILENFYQANAQEEIGVTEDDIDAFYLTWERYDPLATQFIRLGDLSKFISSLEPPLGIQRPDIMITAFDLPILEEDRVHCLDVLMSLIKRAIGGVDEDTAGFQEVKTKMQEKFDKEFPNRVNAQVISSTMKRKKEDIAAKTLQRCWRRHKMQKKIRNITQTAKDQLAEEENWEPEEEQQEKRGISSMFSGIFGSKAATPLPSSQDASRRTSKTSKASRDSSSQNTLQSPKAEKYGATLNLPT